MQVVLFVSFLVAEVAASIVLFRIAPLNPVCVLYPNVWAYTTGQLIASLLVLLAIAIGWWLVGNTAFWESICRTQQRGRVLFQAGLVGLGIDLVSSLLSGYIASFNDGLRLLPQQNILPWLLLRAGIWAVAYSATGAVFLWVLHLDLKSRRLAAASSK